MKTKNEKYKAYGWHCHTCKLEIFDSEKEEEEREKQLIEEIKRGNEEYQSHFFTIIATVQKKDSIVKKRADIEIGRYYGKTYIEAIKKARIVFDREYSYEYKLIRIYTKE